MFDLHLPKSRDDAEALDQTDPLAGCRERFCLPEGITYLVGHSLGPATVSALENVDRTARQDWAEGLVASWNKAGWIDLAEKVGSRLAKLIGVHQSSVMVGDSVSVNLFKLAVAALPLAQHRSISIEESDFPTDQYIAEGGARTAGALFRRLPDGASLAALQEGGVLIKSLVSYRSSEIVDVAAYERAAESSGAQIIWDLSHATGIVPLQLQTQGARFAVGCTYKYLNGGPGAPSFLYVDGNTIGRLQNPIAGWLGHASPFSFSPDYQPADGVKRFVSGTPSILSLAALDGALDAFEGVVLDHALEKARRLGDMLLAKGQSLGLAHSSPLRERRAGHVSLHHPAGYAVVQALAARAVKTDFRTPDIMRFGLSPLFLRYADVWSACEHLEVVINNEEWRQPEFQVREKVT